jgi:hypothetical protein
MAKKVKLSVELVPSTCWFSNVRTNLTPVQWDKIRKISYEKANHKCEICKETGKEQGYKHNVECHEIWEYNDKTRVQRFAGLISLCPRCHQVKHIGRASAIGKQAEAFDQLEKVNGWDHLQVVEHLAEMFEQYKERSKHEWTLDLSILSKEPYSIKLKEKPRKFKPVKWKKKKKKKRSG